MCILSRPRIAIFAVLACLLALAALPCSAQSTSGVVAGSVRDQQGQPLPGATVTVANRGTGRTYQASSDEGGQYRVPEISPGYYDVTVEFPGMQNVEHTQVVIAVDEVTLEDFTLKVANPDTPVLVVTSTAPTTDTTDATLRYDFSTAQIQNLPVLSRDVNNLALLAPGVVNVRAFSFASTLVPFSVNGSRGRENNFIIDSVDNNEPLFGGAATQFTNTDVFAEFTILTHQEDAEFGRNTGATVNVITRSGSNSIHGSAFWFGQDNMFNAMNRADKLADLSSTPRSYENIAGGTLGGPIKKDRTFYFLSYQYDNARDDLTRVFPVLSTLPDSSGLTALKGLTSTPTLAAYLATPSVTKTQIAGGNCFTPTAPAGYNTANPCLAAQPPICVGGSAGGTCAAGAVPVTYNVYNVPRANLFDVRDLESSGRLDQKIGNRNDLYGRYLFDDLDTPNVPLSTAGDSAFDDLGLLPDARLLSRQRTQSAVLDHRFYGVKYLNELRFSYSRVAQGVGAFDEPLATRNTQPAVTVEDKFTQNGFNVPPYNYSQNFTAAGNRFTLGQNSSTSAFKSNIYQIQENFSLIRGRNSLKFGGDFVRTDSGLNSLPENLGQYVFGTFRTSCDELGTSCAANTCTTSPSQCGLTSFVRGVGPSVTFQRLATTAHTSLGLRSYDEAFFAQDTIQVKPRFSLNIGLRYELFGQPIDEVHSLAPGVVPYVSPYRKNFGPRIGFAWSPTDRFVLRAGYGLQYNPTIFEIPLAMWQSGPISPLVVTVSPDVASTVGPAHNESPSGTVVQPNGSFPTSPLSASLASTMVDSCGPDSIKGTNTAALGITLLPGQGKVGGSVPVSNCSSQFTVTNTLRNPYVHNFSLGIQWEVAPSWLVELAWVGSDGNQLLLRQDVNPLGGWNSSLGTCSTFSNQFLGCLNPRKTPGSGDVTQVSNSGSSIYNAFQLSLTKRYTAAQFGDFTFTNAFTWSHDIDDVSELFGPTVQFLGGQGAGLDFASALLTAQGSGLQSLEPLTPFPQDPTNLAPERANSSFDRRLRLASSYLWEPFPTKGIILRGWQLSGIVTFQTGQPFSPLNGTPNGACADAFGQGILTNDRPAVGAAFAPASTVALINTAVDPTCTIPAGGLTTADYTIDPQYAHFVQEPIGTTPWRTFKVGTESFVAGSASRNSILAPSLIEWDGALLKNFHFGESKILQFRWEVYDIANRQNAGFAIGNVFAANAQPTPAFAFGQAETPASVTGAFPENAIDAQAVFGKGLAAKTQPSFLTQQFMNTSSRTMQFGVKFSF